MCLGPTSVNAAITLYLNYQDILNLVPDNSVLTPELFAAISLEKNCPVGELCAISANPWTNAQDGEISSVLSLRVAERTKEFSRVSMRYVFSLDDTPIARNFIEEVSLVLKKSYERKCWKLHDIQHGGDSLLKSINSYKY